MSRPRRTTPVAAGIAAAASPEGRRGGSVFVSIEQIIEGAVERGVARALSQFQQQMAQAAAADPDPAHGGVLTKRDLAARWKCSIRFIEHRVAAGDLRPTRIGGRVYFALDAIAEAERGGKAKRGSAGGVFGGAEAAT